MSGHRPWSEIRRTFSPEQEQRIADRVALMNAYEAELAKLRAILAPLLDDPWIAGYRTDGQGWTCRICGSRDAPRHTPDCAVPNKDALLGRA